jgi:hypothetical protein
MPKKRVGGSLYSAVMSGRQNFQPSARAILEQYGNEPINSIVIARHPLMSALTATGNLLSSQSFDALFHLFMFVNNHITIEKNEIINVAIFKGFIKEDEQMAIHNPPHITIAELLQNTESRMGKERFFN